QLAHPSEKLFSSVALLATDYRNHVLVLRSLTKDYALAALRLGYAVGSAKLVQPICAQLPPWNVNGLAQAAGCAALADQAHLLHTLTLLAVERTEFFHALSQSGFRIVSSQTHFCLVEVGEAARIRQQLLARKILVRDCTSFGLPHFIRVATRQEPDWRRLVA